MSDHTCSKGQLTRTVGGGKDKGRSLLDRENGVLKESFMHNRFDLNVRGEDLCVLAEVN